MKNFKTAAILIGALLAFAPVAARAQSSPNFVNGQVPTAAQWNSYFAAKQDYFGTPAPIATSGSATDLTSGTVPVGRLPLGTTGSPGALQPDGTSITVSGGVIHSVASGGVSSVFTRTGGVTAQTGDYTFAQIGSTPTTLGGYGIADGVSLTGTQTLTNKTLTSPILTTPALGTPSALVLTNATGLPIGGISATGSPSGSTFLAGDGSWKIPPGTGNVNGPGSSVVGNVASYNNTAGTLIQDTGIASSALATLTGTQTLTNKTLSGGANTLSNIANASLTNSAVTIGTTSLSLGASQTAFGGLTTLNGNTLPTASDTFALLAATQTLTNKTLSGAANTINNLSASNLSSGTVAIARLPVGKSVNDPGTGVLEALLPPQTVTGASKTFATADLQLETRRSNSGTVMTDTFPASSATGMANGTRITVNNADTTAIDTITAGAGTTISGNTTDVVEPGRSMAYVYELSTTTWRRTLNTPTAAIFSSVGGNVVGDLLTMRSIYGGVQDSGTPISSIALNGTGAVITTSQSPVAADFNQTCKVFTINATSLNITMPLASTLQPNGGCFFISNPSAFSATVTPNVADNINGGTTGAAVTVPAASLTMVTTDGINGLFVPLASGGSSGFPFTLGSTSITAGATVTSVSGLTLVAPALGTPSALVLTNATGLPVGSITGLGTGVGTLLTGTPSGTTGIAGTASPTFTGTLVANNATLNGTVTLGGITGSSQGVQVNSSGVISGTGAVPVALANANVWTGQQSNTPLTLTIATATFTPGAGNNFKIGLTSACPCTLANPSVTPVAGTSGVMEVDQDATGSRTITTWGSQYQYPGGTSTIAFSSAANAVDYMPFFVKDSTHIVLSPPILNPAH